MKGIIDSTLREGEQTVGVSFSHDLKLEIIRQLCSIGVEEIEVGIASSYDNTPAYLISKCREQHIQGRLAIWCRCNNEDITTAALAGPDVLSLSIPVSDIHIEKKLGKSREWVLNKVEESIIRAKELAIPFISFGLEDATRADPDFVEIVVKKVERFGGDRIRLADTVGVLCPAEIAGLVKKIKNISAVEVGVHMHNDFGMATANSIAAIDSGGDWVDGTLLGLGERAGNARIEELLGYFSLRRKRGYEVGELSSLSRLVSKAAGREIPSCQPIIGESIFSCETGLHIQGIKRDPATYEPYSPECVKTKRKLFYGSKVGQQEIEQCLGERAGLTGEALRVVVERVKTGMRKLDHPLHIREFSEFVELSVTQ